MAKARITVIGTGLIGTSIGLALARRTPRDYELAGYDIDGKRARAAKNLGAFDVAADSSAAAVAGAGIVVVAVPVSDVREVFTAIAPHLTPGAIVTDTASTKGEVMAWAAESLGAAAHFVGGHPMAGKERSGPEAAAADLFEGATWAVIPSATAAEEAVHTITGMAQSVGARPAFFDAAEHDQLAAAVSHLPIAISVALFRLLRDSPAWSDASLLAGPAFRDLTRLASGDPGMSVDIMMTNREAVLHWLRRFQGALADFAEVVERGGEEMLSMFVRTNFDRDNFILNPPVREVPRGPETPTASDTMWRMFAGGLYDKYKEALERGTTEVQRGEEKLKAKLGRDDSAR
jgi:prephenate dehydrogenase